VVPAAGWSARGEAVADGAAVSAHSIIELHCDEPGCTAAIATCQRRVTDARAEAEGAGRWTTAPGRTGERGQFACVLDYCPDHGPGAPR
jgi:hypothetical protein